MRRASDLPRRRTRMRASGRAIVIALGLLFLIVVIFGRALARFYVDMLWYDGLGQSGVFWGAIRARLLLFAVFFLLFAAMAVGNLAIADKLAPSRFPPNAHPVVQRFHETFGRRLRVYRYVLAGVFAFLTAAPTTTQWQSWLLFRNSQSFDDPDPQFHADIGFYVFELPFLSFVLDWLFFAMILVLLLVVMTHVLNGGVMFASPIPTISQAARGHVAVLIAVLAALKAADYWIRRYETTNERRGFVQGATYSVVNALLPALLLLAFVAIVTGGLFLASLRTGSWRLPLVASAVWIVLAIAAGYIYPAAVQGLVVNANQRARESEYIQRNILATRQAMGITAEAVRPETIAFDSLAAPDIAGDIGPLQNVRLLNPEEMTGRFRLEIAQGQSGLTINDLDVDRYPVDGVDQQMLIAARELNLSTAANRSWQGRHLINTRGCGIVRAPASRVEANGQPAYEDVALERPELYFSPALDAYAIAGTTETERSCGANEPYTGDAGVRMSSVLRRGAFALAFLDYNILGSGAIDEDAQMLWVRNIHDRLEKLAPFLSYDGDPYPVVVDGEVFWVVDGYTATARYPYAEAIGDVQLSATSGIPRDANYVRNSVKAVVNAYDGTVDLYVMSDETNSDPIIEAWRQAFPNLFTSADVMPEGLREHLRYPEDLFRVQTSVYSKYQPRYEGDSQAFFDRLDAWSVAQAPAEAPGDLEVIAQTQAPPPQGEEPTEFAEDSSNDRFVPYYTMFNGTGEREFVLLRPFVPFSTNDEQTRLVAYMTASSDPGSYGRLTVYVVEGTMTGPVTVATEIGSSPDVARTITEQVAGDRSAEVSFGDLQLVPISDGLLYVRPFYVARAQSTQNAVPRYEFITVWNDGNAAIGNTLREALGNLFPDLDPDFDIGERGGPGAEPEVEVGDSGAPDSSDPGQSPDDDGSESEPPTITGTPTELLLEADRLLAAADDALRQGDLGRYQSLVDEAAGLIDSALAELDPDSADSSPATTAAQVTETTVAATTDGS